MNTLRISTLALAALAASCSCQYDDPIAENGQSARQDSAVRSPAQQKPPPTIVGDIQGTVVETMNSGGYTYVQIDTGSERVWAAAPAIEVTVGDQVTVKGPVAMAGYRSPTLGRSFDLVYFTAAISIAGKNEGGATLPPGHPTLQGTDPTTPIDLSGIEKPASGITVEEVYLGKARLVGTEVVIRGKVVKFNARILGKNWVHIQDGTGVEGTNDLTITTNATVAVGDTVLVRGRLAADKDYGFGYAYDLIVEDAQVTVE